MKHCTNPACNAELEDYMERCPECGVAQKKVIMHSAQPKSIEVPQDQPTQIQRHGFITFWLYLSAVVNFFVATILLLPKQSYGGFLPDKYVGVSIFCGLLSIVCIIGIFMLLNRKK